MLISTNAALIQVATRAVPTIMHVQQQAMVNLSCCKPHLLSFAPSHFSATWRALSNTICSTAQTCVASLMIDERGMSAGNHQHHSFQEYSKTDKKTAPAGDNVCSKLY